MQRMGSKQAAHRPGGTGNLEKSIIMTNKYMIDGEIDTSKAEFVTPKGAKIVITLRRNTIGSANGWRQADTHTLTVDINGTGYGAPRAIESGMLCLYLGGVKVGLPADVIPAVQSMLDEVAHAAIVDAKNLANECVEATARKQLFAH